MDLTQILTFAGVTALLVMSPGPNGLLIARTVPTSGQAAGFANIAGFVTAFFVHGTLSILGISAVLMASATAFTVVKLVGAAYLVWIGLKALRTAWRGGTVLPQVQPARRRRSLYRAYVEGFLTNALNPKVSMFYLAAFPQFLAASHSDLSAAYLLVVVHSAINIAWFGLLIVMFDRLGRMARGGRFQRWLQAVTGVVFVGFGLKLASLRHP